MYDDYFELLGCERSFDVNQDLLHDNYIKLLQSFHPDKQVNKLQVEKDLAAQISLKINEAYKVLRDEVKRAEYLLSLEGHNISNNKDNYIDYDTEMLNEIMELTENINVDQLHYLKEECINDFKTHYFIKNYEKAAKSIKKLKYLDKIFIDFAK